MFRSRAAMSAASLQTLAMSAPAISNASIVKKNRQIFRATAFG